jgi:hypothetical protein
MNVKLALLTRQPLQCSGATAVDSLQVVKAPHAAYTFRHIGMSPLVISKPPERCLRLIEVLLYLQVRHDVYTPPTLTS